MSLITRRKSKERHRGRHKKENTREGECEKKDRDKVNVSTVIVMGIKQLHAAAATTKIRRPTLLKKRRNLRVLSYRQW